jgi:hypothetical protein
MAKVLVYSSVVEIQSIELEVFLRKSPLPIADLGVMEWQGVGLLHNPMAFSSALDLSMGMRGRVRRAVTMVGLSGTDLTVGGGVFPVE